MNIESNIFFAVRARHLDLIDSAQLVEICKQWSKQKARPLADLMEERGWIRSDQRCELEGELERQRSLHGGDARAALAWATGAGLRETMSMIDDSEVQQTLSELPPPTDLTGVEEAEPPVAGAARYRFTRQYSEGGLGRIWLVRDDDLHREVILKELQPHHAESDEARQRFLREAQITGQLEHPNIVPVYELGQHEEDRPYYTMRFLPGETLRDAIAAYHARGPASGDRALEFRRLLGVFTGVCNAIAYAHSRAVIHRDLKPENVVLGGFGEAILLDWGLAKVAGEREPGADSVELVDSDSRRTAMGTVLGTPAYMAPESAAGDSERVTTRTDIYGLGAILFEILTGQPPHAGVQPGGLIQRVARGETPRARSVRSSTPMALDAICARAMARSPNDRYGDASELAEDVQRWLADEPVSAFTEPLVRRVRRWRRRHRNTTAAALVTAVAIAVGMVNVWWQRSSAIGQELELLGKDARQQTGRLHALMDILRQDVKYLADQRQIAGVLTGASGSRQALGVTFVEFLRNRPNYFQARLLGRDGVELVRAERRTSEIRARRAAEPVTVLERKLQDKSEHDYFRKAITLPGGEVYLSKLELNREGGEIDPRHVPVVRASVPVYASSRPRAGKADGVVVINIDFRPLFQMLQGRSNAVSAERARHVWVTDRAGYYLWNPGAPEKTFGFDRAASPEAECLIQDGYPEVAPFFAVGAHDTEISVVAGAGEGRMAISLYRLSLDDRSPTRFLGLAVAAPYGELIERARARYELPLYLTLTLGLALLLILVSMIAFSRRRDRESGADGVVAKGRFGGQVVTPRPTPHQADPLE